MIKTIIELETETEKSRFINEMKTRTKKLAVDIIKFTGTFPKSKAADVISYQIIKNATSVEANYRAASRSRSRKEFFSKMCIVSEEADETQYWLEIIEQTISSIDLEALSALHKESTEITKIVTKARDNSRS